jgi:predicted nuclease with TOPRIM domain
MIFIGGNRLFPIHENEGFKVEVIKMMKDIEDCSDDDADSRRELKIKHLEYSRNNWKEHAEQLQKENKALREQCEKLLDEIDDLSNLSHP